MNIIIVNFIKKWKIILFFERGFFMSSEKRKRLCQEFARILSGEGMITPEGVCLVQKFRNIRFTILDRRTQSPLVNPQFFTFENVDSRGNA